MQDVLWGNTELEQITFHSDNGRLLGTEKELSVVLSLRLYGLVEIFLRLCTVVQTVLSDSGAPLKFAFCMLKNTTQADFQLKISTPGILAAIRSSGEKVIKLQCWCEWISKIPFRG